MREPVFLIAFAMLFTTVVLVARSIAGAISGRGARSELSGIKHQLEQHAAALEEAENSLAHQSNQLAELQERLDFTERLLAQSRDRSALGPGEPHG